MWLDFLACDSQVLTKMVGRFAGLSTYRLDSLCNCIKEFMLFRVMSSHMFDLESK